MNSPQHTERRRPQLIVAVDVPTTQQLRATVESLPQAVTHYKVGLELFTAAGPATIGTLRDAGKHVFLDLKLHDIPRTVARAVSSAAAHGVAMLTVHAGGGTDMLRAAAEAAEAHDLVLLAVTTLTSLNQEDLITLGVTRPLSEHTIELGRLAVDAGIEGLVCSPHEVSHFRETIGNQPILVVPGIRPAGAALGDQKRVATPAMAVQAGADFLVVGRPILEAEDPAAAAEAVLAEIANAT